MLSSRHFAIIYKRADFSNTIQHYTDLRGADLTGIDFTGSTFIGAHLRGTTGLTPKQRADFKKRGAVVDDET